MRGLWQDFLMRSNLTLTVLTHTPLFIVSEASLTFDFCSLRDPVMRVGAMLRVHTTQLTIAFNMFYLPSSIPRLKFPSQSQKLVVPSAARVACRLLARLRSSIHLPNKDEQSESF